MHFTQYLSAILINLILIGLTSAVAQGQSSAEVNSSRSIQQPLNIAADVAFIGSSACKECHREQHQTWLQTTHSRSMEKAVPQEAQASGRFHHAASNTDYEVLVRNNQIVHRETQLDPSGQPLSTTEHPILYTIGSGTHGKGYIYRENDIFGQSPISWYQETGSWQMSPGYDMPFHPGFGRKLNRECFFCHVGQIDRQENNPNAFKILEEVIGCERCHGPGELHAQKHQGLTAAKLSTPSEHDWTIANPATLPRELSEAICQQCHLQSAGKATRAGKDEWDFRPGQRLTDYRIDYQYRLGDDSMKVVGHVEQLHQSKCYQETQNLTCITCHDPHRTIEPSQQMEHYRSICLHCHDNETCGEPLDRRLSLAKNHCSECHMPKLGSEVPHTAFSHHRIGIHRKNSSPNEVIAGLTPVLNTSGIPQASLQRCEALAKFQVMQEDPTSTDFKDYGTDAARKLIQLKNAQKDDADSNTVLALLARSQQQPGIATDLAQEVVSKENTPSRAKIEAIRLLAQLAYQRRDYSKAIGYYQQLTTYAQEPVDYFFLGISQQNAGKSEDAILSLMRTVELAPNYVEAHRLLSAILKNSQRIAESEKHEDLANRHEARLKALGKSAAQ
ncbi:multiheme c-type cytochrome [Rubripirellula sp.]|jgi:predicted CXXCH cytochrome family protein|nr:multiheme c-type cytochrome [Rubripirellula sp.]